MALRARNVMSLCAGVGGLELGIQLALRLRGEEARGICYVERECAAAASLVASMEAGWFHPAPVCSDMLTFDARPWRGLVHILASGDPCQDNSVAGKRAGSGGSRFLAPEVCRLAAECRPDLIFRENVTGNADGQLEAIVPPLEGLGYRVAAGIFSSSQTGNTMQRERLFIMAEREGCQRCLGEGPERQCLSDTGGCCNEMGSTFGGSYERHPDDAGRGEVRRIATDRASAGNFGEMDCSPHQRHERAGSARRWRNGSADAGGELASASGEGSQGLQLGRSCDGEQHRLDAPRSVTQFRRTLLPPAVIPGPTDSRWIDLLDRFPEYQPALSKEEAESHLRRGIDAMAHRIERLRATGNGVDPLVACTAYLSLSALLAKGRAEAGKPFLMMAPPPEAMDISA